MGRFRGLTLFAEIEEIDWEDFDDEWRAVGGTEFESNSGEADEEITIFFVTEELTSQFIRMRILMKFQLLRHGKKWIFLDPGLSQNPDLILQ